MPKVTREERVEIGKARIMKVLKTHGVANLRTLEQKISDAGPGQMRVDPHLLTAAKHQLEELGLIRRIDAGGGTWFARVDAAEAAVTGRLQDQLAVYAKTQTKDFLKRIGQTMEIAIYRAIQSQAQLLDCLGHYRDLDQHDDSTPYSKEEPPRSLGINTIGGDRRLDFMVRHPAGAGWAGIEAKNIREWLYPNRWEVIDLLSKCVALDAVPVLIARRIHFSTFVVLNACGVVVHQTFNQLYPASNADLAALAKHKTSLGYHDIRVGNLPDSRLVNFIHHHLPAVLPGQRERFDEFKDIIAPFAAQEMPYTEFAARVRRRTQGTNEDHDWEDGE